MSNLFLTAISDATTASSCQTVISVPDYGSDISCTSDCDANFSELAGDDPRLVAESCWRTITSPRGSIPGSPDDGWDVSQLLRTGATPSEQRTWPGLVRSELLKDDRIDSLSVKFRQITSDTWEIAITGTTETGGEFELVGELTATSAVLKDLS